ncbi:MULTISPECIES: Ail/Lom family outer membrane beta-barrel protein [Vibrio]|nr:MULTISPECIES: Ail/Lom family outer membrane beta-barrel protein [Vibrio]
MKQNETLNPLIIRIACNIIIGESNRLIHQLKRELVSMKKQLSLATVLFAVATSYANAASHTIHLGYAQTDLEQITDKLHGLTVKYRFEGTSNLGFLASATITGLENKEYQDLATTNLQLVEKSKRTYSYGSFHFGPVYRLNDTVSLYGTVGYSQLVVESKRDGKDAGKIEDGNFAGGLGFEFNITQRLAMNTGLEYTQHLSNSDAYTYAISLGYRF